MSAMTENRFTRWLAQKLLKCPAPEVSEPVFEHWRPWELTIPKSTRKGSHLRLVAAE